MLLLPDTDEWKMWWQHQQLSAQQIMEISFSEEYAIMLYDPLEDVKDKQRDEELENLRRRIDLMDIPLGAELPAESAFTQHDVYVDAQESLPTPRAVPVFRCSAGVAEVDWGNKTGQPQGLTRDNVISETHCCLEVEVPVLLTMTLFHLIGTRDWKQSFGDCTLPVPFWLSSTEEACGSSARASDGRNDLAPTSVSTQIHLQALGAEIMATLRPDNVMHPHLRCHVEFILGMFASVHLEREDAHEIPLHEFLEGCGIRVQTRSLVDEEQGWVAEFYDKRHGDGLDQVVRPMLHTIWGEKRRALGYSEDGDPKNVWYYLVHDPCPFGSFCTDHKVLLGFGTLCNYWHGFNKKHGNLCTLAANRALGYTQIGNKGRTTKRERVDQYFKTFLENIGMVAPEGTTALDGDERVSCWIAAVVAAVL